MRRIRWVDGEPRECRGDDVTDFDAECALARFINSTSRSARGIKARLPLTYEPGRLIYHGVKLSSGVVHRGFRLLAHIPTPGLVYIDQNGEMVEREPNRVYLYEDLGRDILSGVLGVHEAHEFFTTAIQSKFLNLAEDAISRVGNPSERDRFKMRLLKTIEMAYRAIHTGAYLNSLFNLRSIIAVCEDKSKRRWRHITERCALPVEARDRIASWSFEVSRRVDHLAARLRARVADALEEELKRLGLADYRYVSPSNGIEVPEPDYEDWI